MQTIVNEQYTELIADEGKVLTQANEVDDRIYVKRVCTTKPEEWEEVDAPQHEPIETTSEEQQEDTEESSESGLLTDQDEDIAEEEQT